MPSPGCSTALPLPFLLSWLALSQHLAFKSSSFCSFAIILQRLLLCSNSMKIRAHMWLQEVLLSELPTSWVQGVTPAPRTASRLSFLAIMLLLYSTSMCAICKHIRLLVAVRKTKICCLGRSSSIQFYLHLSSRYTNGKQHTNMVKHTSVKQMQCTDRVLSKTRYDF